VSVLKQVAVAKRRVENLDQRVKNTQAAVDATKKKKDEIKIKRGRSSKEKTQIRTETLENSAVHAAAKIDYENAKKEYDDLLNRVGGAATDALLPSATEESAAAAPATPVVDVANEWAAYAARLQSRGRAPALPPDRSPTPHDTD
jgi:hypothetical protein